MIIEFHNGLAIDLNRVVEIGPMQYEEDDYDSYSIVLITKQVVVAFDSTKECDGTKLAQYPRKELIQQWRDLVDRKNNLSIESQQLLIETLSAQVDRLSEENRRLRDRCDELWQEWQNAIEVR